MSGPSHDDPPIPADIDPLDTFWNRIVELHDDPRRAYPRVQIGLDVQLQIRSRTVRGSTYDIGRGGFQLRCDPPTAARIAPPRGAAGDELTARVMLATGDREQSIEVRCRVAHVSPVPGDAAPGPKVALGFSFTSIGRQERQALEQFIIAHLEPAACPT